MRYIFCCRARVISPCVSLWSPERQEGKVDVCPSQIFERIMLKAEGEDITETLEIG